MFQVALATDGTISLAYFIYGDIKWGRNSNMGFRNADGTRVFMLPGALTEETFEIELTSNIGHPGLYIIQVDGMYKFSLKVTVSNITIMSFFVSHKELGLGTFI